MVKGIASDDFEADELAMVVVMLVQQAYYPQWYVMRVALLVLAAV
jgi:hypothetical protein